LNRLYAGVPYANADNKALSTAASSVTTSGLPSRLRTFSESKASRLVMHALGNGLRGVIPVIGSMGSFTFKRGT
jgi:hypothetical protein